MKKLLTFSVVIALIMGASCTDSKEDKPQNILIPQTELSMSIAADQLSHALRFETTQSWQATVRETRAENWISISPSSGDAGKHTITVTLTENTAESSRKATITIVCGDDRIDVSVTQRGKGEPEGPDDPNLPRPEHPEVAPENRLTYIEIESEENYSGTTYRSKEYLLLSYDEKGNLISSENYSFDREQTDKLDASYITRIERSAGKMFSKEELFEIGSGYEGLPIPHRSTWNIDYTLNTGGRISYYTDPDGDRTSFTYNADGTLAAVEYNSLSYPDENYRETFTWQDGNIVRTGAMTLAYTDHLAPWNGIDINTFTFGDYEEVGRMLGICGMTTRNLPASITDSDEGEVVEFTYEFDAAGRIGKIIAVSTWSDGTDRMEYTLHYGPQNVPQPDYITHLTKQEVAEEGTLPYVFYADTPDEHIYGINAYTSYVKIRNMFSDGSTSEKTEYREVNTWLDNVEGSILSYLYVSQEDVDNFKLVSTSFREEVEDSYYGPHRFIYTLEYNCFLVELSCEIYQPTCMIYDVDASESKEYLMPMHPIDETNLTLFQPELRKIFEEEMQTEYEYKQEYLFRINPDVEPSENDRQMLLRYLYVAHSAE